MYCNEYAPWSASQAFIFTAMARRNKCIYNVNKASALRCLGKAGFVLKNRQKKEADVNALRMHFLPRYSSAAVPCPPSSALHRRCHQACSGEADFVS
jgi:hypothetical protein|nr:hypothetical protein [uncultured Ottowia sp.]